MAIDDKLRIADLEEQVRRLTGELHNLASAYDRLTVTAADATARLNRCAELLDVSGITETTVTDEEFALSDPRQ